MAGGGRVVCIAEPLVDFVCEEPVASLGEAPGFVPRVGGSPANIAVVAARFGAAAELAGIGGDDEWGRWLRARLEGHGVGTGAYVLVPGRQTTHAFVAVSADGEPSFAFYGDARPAAEPLAGEAAAALRGGAGALVIGSDTAIGPGERDATLATAERARGVGWRVLCDPNLRPGRWAGEGEMLATARALVREADVVKCNAAEAMSITGEPSTEDAAAALLSLGPSASVVTCAGEGVLAVTAAGTARERAAVGIEVVDATGAGDSVAGVLAAALAAGVAVEELPRALPLAMQTAAAVVGAVGAVAGLPPARECRDALAAILAPD